MNKIMIMILSLMVSFGASAETSSDQPAQTPPQAVNYAAENQAAAIKILDAMSVQDRINQAHLYFFQDWQKLCKGKGGRLHMLSIDYAEDGVSSISCHTQLLTQVRMSDDNHILVRFPGSGNEWIKQNHVQELCMFQPEKCNIKK